MAVHWQAGSGLLPPKGTHAAGPSLISVPSHQAGPKQGPEPLRTAFRFQFSPKYLQIPPLSTYMPATEPLPPCLGLHVVG